MASDQHQKLINSLANALEKDGVTITHIDIDGKPECFDEKYRDLPPPTERDGHIPDLEGTKDGLKNLGEAKIAIDGDDNLDSQFKVFANRVVKDKPVPFHIVVPKSIKPDLDKKLDELELSDKVKSGQIVVWTNG